MTKLEIVQNFQGLLATIHRAQEELQKNNPVMAYRAVNDSEEFARRLRDEFVKPS